MKLFFRLSANLNLKQTKFTKRISLFSLFQFFVLTNICFIPFVSFADIINEEHRNKIDNYPNIPLAQRCTNKSQKDKFGKVQDQGNLGWCYGYTAADLYTHALKLPKDSPVSPLWMSANFQLTDPKEFAKIAIQNINLTRDFQSAFIHVLTEQNNLAKDETGQYLYPYQPTEIDKARNQQYGSLAAKSPEGFNLVDGMGGSVSNSLTIALSKPQICNTKDLHNFESLAPDAAAQALHILSSKKPCNPSKKRNGNLTNIAELNSQLHLELAKYLNNHCKQPRPKEIPFRVVRQQYSDTNPIDGELRDQGLYAINSILDNDGVLSISYRAKVIMRTDPGIHDRHASTLIGRRLIGDKCFYQIRNSWGDSCEYYKNNPNKVICEDGGSILVEENELLDNLNGIIYLEEFRTSIKNKPNSDSKKTKARK